MLYSPSTKTLLKHGFIPAPEYTPYKGYILNVKADYGVNLTIEYIEGDWIIWIYYYGRGSDDGETPYTIYPRTYKDIKNFISMFSEDWLFE